MERTPIKMPKCFGNPEPECVTKCEMEAECANLCRLIHKIGEAEKEKMSDQKVKYVDWFGSKIEESIGDMIARIKTHQKEKTMLKKRLLEFEIKKGE